MMLMMEAGKFIAALKEWFVERLLMYDTEKLTAEKAISMLNNYEHVLIEAAEAINRNALTRPVLIDIQRRDRSNVFTFQRGDETYQIETYASMEDNVAEWKAKLID